MVYSSLAAGRVQGIEVCPMPYDDPDCPICLERYQSNALVLYNAEYAASSISRAAKLTRAVASKPADHSPLKLPCCRNKICRECLNAWLSVSDTCPICRGKLVMPPPLVRMRRFIDWVLGLVNFESPVVVVHPPPPSEAAHAPSNDVYSDSDDSDDSRNYDYELYHDEDYGVLPLFCGWEECWTDLWRD
ncbi:hypothetical protein Ptr902_01132 [Pyrenophora tritici-repentis]|nr:hypothetical protein Ptr902_01132 [Pyrenophora tritici-repentis]